MPRTRRISGEDGSRIDCFLYQWDVDDTEHDDDGDTVSAAIGVLEWLRSQYFGG